MENRDTMKRLRDTAAGSRSSWVSELGGGAVWLSVVASGVDGLGSGVRS